MVLGDNSVRQILTRDSIPPGHELALRHIARGERREERVVARGEKRHEPKWSSFAARPRWP